MGSVGEVPVGELVTVTGVLLGREECREGEGNTALLLGEEEGGGQEGVTLYHPTPSLPPALLPGLWLEASAVLRAVSKKGRNYFTATPLTRIEVRLHPPSSPPSAPLPQLCISLESVFSLKLEANCGGCASPLSGGTCSYIGCSVKVNLIPFSSSSATPLS